MELFICCLELDAIAALLPGYLPLKNSGWVNNLAYPAEIAIVSNRPLVAQGGRKLLEEINAQDQEARALEYSKPKISNAKDQVFLNLFTY